MRRVSSAEGCGIAARRFLILAAFAAALWRPAFASSAEFRGLTLSPQGPYGPGTRITVTWEALPPGTEEFELLLRCKLPAPLKLRLTECMDPRLRRLEWTVANVPCPSATLVLRAGIGGREITWSRSAPFEIRADVRAPLPAVVVSRGELWLGSDPASRRLRTAGGGQWSAPSARTVAAEIPPTRDPGFQSAGIPGCHILPGARSRAPRAHSRADGLRAPLDLPLRI